ncbi:MAG: hypothetical protein RIT02_1544, partial [Planctomycetota bacterium]
MLSIIATFCQQNTMTGSRTTVAA